MSDEAKWTTIVDYLQGELNEDLSGIRDDAFQLPNRVRELLRNWKPTKKSPRKGHRGKILSTLNDILNPRKSYVYYFPGNADFGIPEGYVDFTRLFSVVTAKLQALSDQRVGTLASPYREEFAAKLGAYLSSDSHSHAACSTRRVNNG